MDIVCAISAAPHLPFDLRAFVAPETPTVETAVDALAAAGSDERRTLVPLI